LELIDVLDARLFASLPCPFPVPSPSPSTSSSAKVGKESAELDAGFREYSVSRPNGNGWLVVCGRGGGGWERGSAECALLCPGLFALAAPSPVEEIEDLLPLSSAQSSGTGGKTFLGLEGDGAGVLVAEGG
jgi:hypothetical protein